MEIVNNFPALLCILKYKCQIWFLTFSVTRTDRFTCKIAKKDKKISRSREVGTGSDQVLSHLLL